MEFKIKAKAVEFANNILESAEKSNNEAEFRSKITILIDKFSKELNLKLHSREEYVLINGRIDSVYNRCIIEYEPPRSLRENNDYRHNIHAIKQIKDYIDGLMKKEKHKAERLAGVILDGSYFIFIRKTEASWHVDPPYKVNEYSTEKFLKLLLSLYVEFALIPENLVRDFGEGTYISKPAVKALYNILQTTQSKKTNILFQQWSLQFSEICDYEETSRLKIDTYARKFGIEGKDIDPFKFFFCLHTYYATFIKLLALQIVHYYAMPKFGTDLKKAASFVDEELKSYLTKMEDGGIFKEFGILNFLEGDFFSWYLDVWDDEIYKAFKGIIAKLADYSLVTLDVDPDTTRDLLKKLYQQLMPRQLRHNLGEYYTPDWLAERLLNMLEAGKFEGDPDRRILDPSCGSGTFLVLIIKKMREFAWKNALHETQALEKILKNVVGFDLNPLAVISARTNYLLALGDLISHRKEDINIPVYNCDSILTPQENHDLFEKDVLKFNTVVSPLVGPFRVPKILVKANYIDILSNFLEEAVKCKYDKDQFIEMLCSRLPLHKDREKAEVEVVFELYKQLMELKNQGINGIWARIIKNAFAPLFTGEFDYIVGNPPWVNWESLPENYRLETKPLWISYGLFPHGGMDTILGKGKKDISMIMTYVAMDKYLKNNGLLGFLITQSIFKTAGAGQGFRSFKLGEKGLPMMVKHVDDMSELNPFEGASNRTSVMILQKGMKNRYPVSYTYWKKTAIGRTIPLDATLEEASDMTVRKNFKAYPVDENDKTSPWLTGKPRVIKVIKKVLGVSDYCAHAGVYSGGANAIYWVNILEKRHDGLVIISNITEGAKKKVENVQVAIEPDLLYPLLRGRDVQKWRAIPSAHIIMVQDPMKRRGIDEDDLKMKYPKTYIYLKSFEKILRERKVLKRFFTRKDAKNNTVETGPFYSMFAVSDYTFAPYKVVWPWISIGIRASVVSLWGKKTICPEHNTTFVGCDKKEEAHYICGLLNSSLGDFTIRTFYSGGGSGIASPNVLQKIFIPKFDSQNPHHLNLSELSEKAHELAKVEDNEQLYKIEDDINRVAAKIWDITDKELKEINDSLKELN
jgi:hypothetical protein